MRYHTTDSDGVSEVEPNAKRMMVLILQLHGCEEADFPEVSLYHESGWVLTYTIERTLLLENDLLADEGIRFMRKMSSRETHRIWMLLANNEIDALKSEPWMIE
jgi:hypothetical protein